VLYFRVPTPNDWDCKAFIDGNNERCDQIDAAEGDWSVMIRPFGPGGFSNVLLEAFLFEAVSITTAGLPGGSVGVPYNATLQTSDGDGIYLWELQGGALPPGLELASDGTISAPPTAGGQYTFTVRVISAGKPAEVEHTISVGPAPGPVVFGRGGSAIDPTGARTLR